MATTRANTGHSKPRVFPKVEEVSAVKKSGPKKAGPKKATTKANTSKPRAKKVATGRVTKPAAPKEKTATAAPKKSAPKAIADKVNGAVLKADGAVAAKPGKKVCQFCAERRVRRSCCCAAG